MKPVKLRDLRRIELPAFVEGEADHITSLRKTLEFHADYPDSAQVSVPQIMLDMIPPKPAEPTEPPAQLEQPAFNSETPSASPDLVNSAVTAAAAPLAAPAAVIQPEPQTVAEPKAKKPRPALLPDTETVAEAEPTEASSATE